MALEVRQSVLDRVAEFCRRNGIHRLAIFGSALRDDFTPQSDVDVLVEFEPGRTPGFRFITLQDQLGDILGHRVDLNTPQCLSRYFRDRVLRKPASSMTQHDDEVRLRHMLDHAREAVEIAAPFKRRDLDENRMLTLALVHLIEIIGEAGGRVSVETQASNSEIPWKEITGTRHRIVHGYDTINLDIVWSVIKTDLPGLIEQLERALSN